MGPEGLPIEAGVLLRFPGNRAKSPQASVGTFDQREGRQSPHRAGGAVVPQARKALWTHRSGVSLPGIGATSLNTAPTVKPLLNWGRLSAYRQMEGAAERSQLGPSDHRAAEMTPVPSTARARGRPPAQRMEAGDQPPPPPERDSDAGPSSISATLPWFASPSVRRADARARRSGRGGGRLPGTRSTPRRRGALRTATEPRAAAAGEKEQPRVVAGCRARRMRPARRKAADSPGGSRRAAARTRASRAAPPRRPRPPAQVGAKPARATSSTTAWPPRFVATRSPSRRRQLGARRCASARAPRLWPPRSPTHDRERHRRRGGPVRWRRRGEADARRPDVAAGGAAWPSCRREDRQRAHQDSRGHATPAPSVPLCRAQSCRSRAADRSANAVQSRSARSPSRYSRRWSAGRRAPPARPRQRAEAERGLKRRVSTGWTSTSTAALPMSLPPLPDVTRGAGHAVARRRCGGIESASLWLLSVQPAPARTTASVSSLQVRRRPRSRRGSVADGSATVATADMSRACAARKRICVARPRPFHPKRRGSCRCDVVRRSADPIEPDDAAQRGSSAQAAASR